MFYKVRQSPLLFGFEDRACVYGKGQECPAFGHSVFQQEVPHPRRKRACYGLLHKGNGLRKVSHRTGRSGSCPASAGQNEQGDKYGGKACSEFYCCRFGDTQELFSDIMAFHKDIIVKKRRFCKVTPLVSFAFTAKMCYSKMVQL
jgi:hypothetical protein